MPKFSFKKYRISEKYQIKITKSSNNLILQKKHSKCPKQGENITPKNLIYIFHCKKKI